jgi:nitroreductase
VSIRASAPSARARQPAGFFAVKNDDLRTALDEVGWQRVDATMGNSDAPAILN